jgi:hypothetical protein
MRGTIACQIRRRPVGCEPVVGSRRTYRKDARKPPALAGGAVTRREGAKKMDRTHLVLPENDIAFGQDFRFFRGIPSGIDFEVKQMGTLVKLIAPGYGGEPYGNGALYLNVAEYQKATQIALESRVIDQIDRPVYNTHCPHVNGISLEETVFCSGCGSWVVGTEVGTVTVKLYYDGRLEFGGSGFVPEVANETDSH